MVHFLSRLFSFFSPSSVFGVDCSDGVLRFMAVSQRHGGKKCFTPIQYGEIALMSGAITQGVVTERTLLVHSLKEVNKKHTINRVRFAIPAAISYCFALSLSKKIKNTKKAVEAVIGEYIPMQKTEIAIDCSVVHSYGDSNIVRVIAVEKKIIQQYSDSFIAAGILPIHFELEAQVIANAVLPSGDSGVVLIVTLQVNETIVAITYKGVVVYTVVLPKGGSNLISDVATHGVVAPNEAHAMVYEYGFTSPTEHQVLFGVLSDSVASIIDHIKTVTVEWNTQKVRKEIFPAITSVIVAGQYSIIPGLVEYINIQLGIATVLANPWEQCAPCEGVVPALPYEEAVKYTTVIGLAVQSHCYE